MPIFTSSCLDNRHVMVFYLFVGATRRMDPKRSYSYWTFFFSSSFFPVGAMVDPKRSSRGHGWSEVIGCCSLEGWLLWRALGFLLCRSPFTPSRMLSPSAAHPPRAFLGGSCQHRSSSSTESLAVPLALFLAWCDSPGKALTVSLLLLSSLFLLQCGLAVLHYILQKNIWEDSEVASWFCTSVSFTFHAVSPRPGLVKLLALSNLQARRRIVVWVSPDTRPVFVYLNSWYFVIGAAYPTIECALLLQVSRTQWLLCADPPPLLVHRRWLDSGMVLSSLTHSTLED